MTTAASEQVLEDLRSAGVVAVLRSDSVEDAVEVATALAEVGVHALEVTFTVPGAEKVIARLTADLDPHVLVGAGTVLDRGQADRAVEAGARFLVSPGLPEGRAMFEAGADVPFIPGVLTPSEVMAALDSGAAAVKLFPAATVGPDYLAALRGPFPDLRVIPTGGIRPDAVAAWLSGGAMAVGMGGALCPRRLRDDTDRARLKSAAERVLASVEQARQETKGAPR